MTEKIPRKGPMKDDRTSTPTKTERGLEVSDFLVGKRKVIVEQLVDGPDDDYDTDRDD